jgi:DNA repair protein RadA/Sms
VTVTIEGTRPVLVEIQALVVPTTLAMPRRLAGGVDYNRLQMVVAVLTKRLRLPLSTYDIFVNITGGFKIEEPAADLGMALAIISSFKNIPLDSKTACFGEVGLLGELRSVSQGSKRKIEAKRLGFTKVISPDEYRSIDRLAKLFKS